MPVFKWRRRTTKHFGEVWFPFAQIELLGADGEFQPVAIQVDSGATVSLLRRSAANLLRIDLHAGKKIDLGGVGGGAINAYLHFIETKLDEAWSANKIPFAIAESEEAPNLLGRLGVFDSLQIDFDASLLETRITARWLDAGDRRVWEWLIEAETHIYSRLDAIGWSQAAREAIRRFLNRADLLVATVAGLAKLHRAFAAPLIVRGLFEVAAQFQYMMQDRDNRAQQYLDFEHITRKLQMNASLNGPPGLIRDRLQNSPHRKAGETRVNTEFQRVESKFKNRKGTPFKNWNCIQFAQLIDQLDKQQYAWKADYEIWYKQFSGWAHGDPFATSQDTPMPLLQPRDWLVQTYCFRARMLLRVADDGMMILSSEQDSGLREVAKGLY